jgi:flavin-dependent dehydrogenase
LRQAAVAAGAEFVQARAVEPLGADDGIGTGLGKGSDDSLGGYRLSTGDEWRADYVIGADGATSGVAATAGLVDADRVLWGFAVRTYLPQKMEELAAIVMWEPARWRAFPGYGWVFPGADSGVNVGLGIATRADRHAGARAVRALPEFLRHLHAVGLLADAPPAELPPRLGGWLKMGMVGTTPARGRVLLVGDAAGLINPLQGEGIAQAMGSGVMAAECILAGAGAGAGAVGAGDVAAQYRSALCAAHMPYQRITAVAQAGLVGRPRAISVLSRLLIAAGVSDSVAGGWAVFWNELLDGAPPGRHRSVAAALTRLGDAVTARTAAARWIDTTPLRAPSTVVRVDAGAGAGSRAVAAHTGSTGAP